MDNNNNKSKWLKPEDYKAKEKDQPKAVMPKVDLNRLRSKMYGIKN